MHERKIRRLAKPMKTGLLHLIFSRFLVIILLLGLQVAIFAGFYGWLSKLTHYMAALQLVFTALMVIYLFNNSMDSSAKLTWMFLIALFPLPGAAMLLFTQTNLGHRALKERVDFRLEKTKSLLDQPEGVLEELEKEGGGTEDLVRYLNRSGCFPAYKNTAVTYFPDGEDTFRALLEELEKATTYIFMEYYIIEEGYMWGSILDVLIRKAQAGVDVRVMYDGMSELFNLPYGYWKLMEKQGIHTQRFAPIRPVVSSHYNYRDHRKIVVIDGKTAFTGGVNLSDEYINRIIRFGYWKDTAVMLKGPAAESFALMFLQLWNTDKSSWQQLELPPKAEASEQTDEEEGYVIPYADCPLDEDKVGETVYMDILYHAADYVHIMTPYLILDGEMEAALKYAAQRGVDVKIILPGIPDKKLAYALAKSHYERLLNAGVSLYEYEPGFVHAKSFVSDDKKAVVGTINLDYRSLYHHFECAVYCYKTPCIADIEADFQSTLSKCTPVTEESVRDEKFFYRAAGWILKFVAPLF